MIAGSCSKEKEEAHTNGLPHLSHSRINRYLLCPEQYRLYYIEKLRPRIYSAVLVFGQVVHQALAAFFQTGTDPTTTFAAQWKEVERVELRWRAPQLTRVYE